MDLATQPCYGTVGKYVAINIKFQSNNILYLSGLANYLFSWVLGNAIGAICSKCFWNENNITYCQLLYVVWVCVGQNQTQMKTSVVSNSPKHAGTNQFVMGILKYFWDDLDAGEKLFYVALHIIVFFLF